MAGCPEMTDAGKKVFGQIEQKRLRQLVRLVARIRGRLVSVSDDRELTDIEKSILSSIRRCLPLTR